MYILSIPTNHLDKLKFFFNHLFFLPVAAVVSMSCRAWIQSPRASDEHEMRSISKCLCRTGKKAESWAKLGNLQIHVSWFLVWINFWKSMFCVTQNQRVLVKAPQLHLAEEIQCCMPSLWADSLRVIGYFLQVVSVRNHTFHLSIIENRKWRCSNLGTFQITQACFILLWNHWS